MSERRRPFPGSDYLTDEEYERAMSGELSVTDAVDLAVERKAAAKDTGKREPFTGDLPLAGNPYPQT